MKFYQGNGGIQNTIMNKEINECESNEYEENLTDKKMGKN